MEPSELKPITLTPRERAVFRAAAVGGYPRVQVAREFGLRPYEVAAIVRRGHEELAGRVVFHDRQWLKTLHLYRLDHLWQEALAAWYRSQQHEETHKATQVEGKPAKVEVARRTQVGEIRFLALAGRLLAAMEAVNDELAAEFQRAAGDLLDGTTDSDDERIDAIAQFLQLVIDRRRAHEVIEPLGGSSPEESGG